MPSLSTRVYQLKLISGSRQVAAKSATTFNSVSVEITNFNGLVPAHVVRHFGRIENIALFEFRVSIESTGHSEE